MKKKTVLRAVCMAGLAIAMLFTSSCGLLGGRPEKEPEETRTPRATKKPAKPAATEPAATEYPEITHPPVEMMDAEEYFQEHGQVLDIVPIGESDSLLSETQVYALLRERGFTEYPVTTGLDAEGGMMEEIEISETSSAKHPIYETYFTSSEGMLWIITVIGDNVTANPFQYNLQTDKTAMTVIVETDHVTSYDNATKRFFDTVPDEDTLITKRVERIDAATLDAMTMEEIEK